MDNKKVYVISGPTAVGKSAVAIQLAKKIDGEIVNCDSVQLYKYMDIGSAKPSEAELNEVPHHLFSIVNPDYKMTVATYQKLAFAIIDNILERGKTPIVVGGTGLYLNSIIYEMDFAGDSKDSERRKELEEMAEKMGNKYMHDYLSGIDPETASKIHPNNIRKVVRAIEAYEAGDGIKSLDTCPMNDRYDFEFYALTMEREWLYDRINRRVISLVKAGLIEEVRKLLAMGYTVELPSMKAIGYKEIAAYLAGETDKLEAVKLLMRNTRRYAKRQITWLKRYDDVKWIEIQKGDTIGDVVDRMLEG
ncbi:MAG: tRNA (adenosine(37)-N6)-dimethylallyltransferase MiaA [Clostridiales bacterium]|nr:tRNA (adenosine(37)-N6)-dimethylallyltransferase MiaA [Candidatus Crickella merdequi]